MPNANYDVYIEALNKQQYKTSYSNGILLIEYALSSLSMDRAFNEDVNKKLNDLGYHDSKMLDSYYWYFRGVQDATASWISQKQPNGNYLPTDGDYFHFRMDDDCKTLVIFALIEYRKSHTNNDNQEPIDKLINYLETAHDEKA